MFVRRQCDGLRKSRVEPGIREHWANDVDIPPKVRRPVRSSEVQHEITGFCDQRELKLAILEGTGMYSIALSDGILPCLINDLEA